MASVRALQLVQHTHMHTHNHTHTHTCTHKRERFFPVQPSEGSSILHSNVNTPTAYGNLWTSRIGTCALKQTHIHTQPLTITDTNPPLLLIPSPPAVKISPPSNPHSSTQSLVSAGSLKKTCRLLVCAELRCECILIPAVHQKAHTFLGPPAEMGPSFLEMTFATSHLGKVTDVNASLNQLKVGYRCQPTLIQCKPVGYMLGTHRSLQAHLSLSQLFSLFHVPTTCAGHKSPSCCRSRALRDTLERQVADERTVTMLLLLPVRAYDKNRAAEGT